MAFTGHMGEFPKLGIFKSLMESLLCIVFVHLIKRWMPGGAKKTSPLVICSSGENACIECGTRFEILKMKKMQANIKP